MFPSYYHVYTVLFFLSISFFFIIIQDQSIESNSINQPVAPFTVPYIVQGNVDCNYGQDGCTPCVKDVEEKIKNLFSYKTKKHRIVYYTLPNEPFWKIKNHIQGIARLPDVKIDTFSNGQSAAAQIKGRIVITRDRNEGSGLYIIDQPVISGENNGPLAYKEREDGAYIVRIDMTDSGLNHPGGIQVLGTTLAVAIECSKCYVHSEIRFFEFGNGFSPREVNRLILDGSRGEPQQIRRKAASVAFTKLKGGKYLLFVAGAKHGLEGGWFYISSNTEISSQTEWYFLQYWTPNCTDIRKGCWTGASNMTFLNDCVESHKGNIYLIATHGKATFFGSSTNYINVNRIRQDSSTGRIDIENIDLIQPKTKDTAIGLGCSYRWAGNFFVTPQGALYSEVTDREVNCRGALKVEQIAIGN